MGSQSRQCRGMWLACIGAVRTLIIEESLVCAMHRPGSNHTFDWTQGTRKGHESAALKHRVGPGVSTRWFHRKVTGFSRAQINGIPLGSCAESFIA